MIITCPNCEKRYQVEDEQIGEKGRKLRCVSCKHVWSYVPIQTSTKRPEIRHLANSNPKIFPDKAPSTISFGWSSLVVCILITLGSFWGARETIVANWPGARSIYQLFGITMPIPGEGLVFNNTKPMHVAEADSSYIIIKGEITNTSDDVVLVPALQLQIDGICHKVPWWRRAWSYMHGQKAAKSQPCTLDQWRHPLSQKRLLAGEKIQFETEPYTTVADATQIKLFF